MFKYFFPFTGGRVGEIVSQQSQWCGKKDALPLSKEEDKFDKFCKTYKGFIDVADAHQRFESFWAIQKDLAASAEKKSIKPLLRSLYLSFSYDLLMAFLYKLVWSILVICSIYFFVFDILEFIDDRKEGTLKPGQKAHEYYLCFGFFVAMVVLSLGIQQMGMYSSFLGLKVKAALTTAIYKKMIVRDAYGSKADVVSLVGKDVEKLAEACLSLQYLWSGIVETFAVFAVVFALMGAPIFPGIGLMVLFLPLQYILGLKVAYMQKDLTRVSNRRIGLMEEILRGIKLIKIYGWETSFFKSIQNVRKEETDFLSRANVYKSTILGLIFALPPLMCMVIFGTEEATGKIESVLVFTVLSFFNTLRVPFSKLPKSLRDVLDGISCMERIQDFLLEPELTVVDEDHDHKGVVFKNVSLSYGVDAKIVLSNVNLDIPQGTLVMVAGPVASGKSNLLKGILGDLTVREGTCAESKSKAYVPQTPWTALGTVKDNILFGKPYDEALYRQVIHACALEPDLKLMPNGDSTWIGERGGNLSGGQKQRIALARAAYSQADLYVLDSPLSAVDMYSCQHIFKHCIEELMIAGGGTVILATHQTELFALSDHLIVLKDGDIVYNDKYNYSGVKPFFPTLASHVDASAAERSAKKVVKGTSSTEKHALASNKTMEMMIEPAPLALAKQEESIYLWYIKQIRPHWFALATLVFMCGQTCRVYSDAWISNWSKRKYDAAGYTSDMFYIGIYMLAVTVFLGLSLIRAFYWFQIGKNGANRIHDMAFEAALKAPMHYFHVTPVGELLSFFSHEIDVMDDALVDNTLMLQIFFWILICALGVVAYNLVTFLAIVAVLGAIYIFVVDVYIRTSVPLKKASSHSLSHVVAHTSETLSGLAIVRAFRMEERFLTENLRFQSEATVVSFSISNLALWLAFRVDIIGCLLVLTCCLLAVLDESLDASDAGLIVSNSFQILLFFSIMSRTMGDVHNNMDAVQAARTLSNVEAEHEPTDEVIVPKQWPSEGTITFEGVVMPYLPNTPPVLKGISFTVREGEKIGVVGRTGAGKSSLIVALYRLAEIRKGRIMVDSVDCSRVKLNTLRSSMAIIPQEPVMFSGTLRSNLDPFNERQDKEILDVLYRCLLGPLVEGNPDGLNAKVKILGSNFSLGTQQLICLARAMLNPSRILLLDEATAALDSDTNNKVQHVLKEHFSDRTIFTIAHRLDTIIDSDRILVMNGGLVAEFDSPDVLLSDPQSIFYELCMNAGEAQFNSLSARARTAAIEKANRPVKADPRAEVFV